MPLQEATVLLPGMACGHESFSSGFSVQRPLLAVRQGAAVQAQELRGAAFPAVKLEKMGWSSRPAIGFLFYPVKVGESCLSCASWRTDAQLSKCTV